MATLCQDYSGVALNQNAPSSGFYHWRTDGGLIIYQTFELPADFQRGSAPTEQRIPDISGFSVLVAIDEGYAETAALDARLDWFSTSWNNVAQGTLIGAQTDGPYVWFDAMLTSSVPVSRSMERATWRLGVSIPTTQNGAFKQPITAQQGNQYAIGQEIFTATLVDGVPYPIIIQGEPGFLLSQGGVVTWSLQQGISGISYTQPSPIVGALYDYTGTNQLYTPTASLNFRVFALQADTGIDFLGNEYRSVVINAPSANVQTTAGSIPVAGAGQAPFWMSQVFPSPTAVQSLYFDVRPVPTTPVFKQVNQIENPSFEYDALGHPPAWWQFVSGGGTGTIEVVSSWAAQGTNSAFLNIAATNDTPWLLQSPLVPFPALTNAAPTPVNFSCVYDMIAETTATLKLVVQFFDATHAPLTAPVLASTTTVGVHILSGSALAPTSTAYIQYSLQIIPSSSGGSMQVNVDAFQATTTPTLQMYFDGDSATCVWLGQAGNSESAQEVIQGPQDQFVVIDGVVIDPITPNMHFNVYYTQDDTGTSTNMSQEDWDTKLWSRVPRVYNAVSRKQYIFPDPVHAKYMKVEFTNPQAQSYNPGDFQRPISYQQFPTWVTNYFNANNPMNPITAASVVNVQYDALSIGLLPYLGDLVQTPAPPIAVPDDVQTTLSDYWKSNTLTVDSTTLSQIDLSTNKFQSPLGTGISGGVVGNVVNNIVNQPVNGPIGVQEGDPNDLPVSDLTTVSSLNRDAVLAEQIAPDMYFYLTCRHTYKQSNAVFDYNRGYVFGVKDIAFVRNNYTVPSDTGLYVETSGDSTNTSFSDFILDPSGCWYTYV